MKKVMLDQMILTSCCPTDAGSKMLEGFTSLFDATVVEKLTGAGYEIAGKAPVGEFAIDLVGETNYKGERFDAECLKNDTVQALIAFDVNGAPRRIAAQQGVVFAKPTYGTVSRFGTVSVACSGECVGVMAANVADCREVLRTVTGKDEKDGTMHGFVACADRITTVAVLKTGTAADESAEMIAAKEKMAANGIQTVEMDIGVIAAANAAWNVLMSAELCNNVSRYDGIKYGYRTKNYKTLEELYTNSRTEAFGLLLKTAILYGSDVLSTKNYMAKYDKALRVRRVIVEAFAKIFEGVGAVLLPAVSKATYDESDSAFAENVYTAPASVTGLPAVVAGGVQLISPACTDEALLDLAEML